MVCEQKKTRNKPKSTKAKIIPIRASLNDRPHSAGQKIQISSKKMSSDTLPSSNIRFSHFMSRCGSRNTVIKCRALNVSSKFAVKEVGKKPIQLSGESSPVDENEIKKAIHKMPETILQINKPIYKIPEIIPQINKSLHKMHETQCEVKQDVKVERSPLPQLKQDDVLLKIFGMCEICDEVDPLLSKNRIVESGGEKIAIEYSNNNKIKYDEQSVKNDLKLLTLNNSLEKNHIDDVEEAVPEYAAVSIITVHKS